MKLKQMYQDLNFKFKSILSFGVVILIAFIAILWMLFQMNAIAQKTQALYDQPFAAQNHMWTIRRDILDTKSDLYQLLTAKGTDYAFDESSVKKDFDANVTEITDSLNFMTASFTSPEKVALLNQIQSQVSSAASAWEDVYNLATTNHVTEAFEQMTNSYEPLVDQLINTVLQLADIVSDDAVNFVDSANNSARVTIIIGIAALALSTLFSLSLATAFSRSITTPLNQLAIVAKEMNNGNFHAADQITYFSKDEMGRVAQSLRETSETMDAYINEIAEILTQMSKGDLTRPWTNITDYRGEFAPIKDAFVRILKDFNKTLTNIHTASAQVDAGSTQVATAAQTLSQGSSEQSSAVQDLTTTIAEISSQIQVNTENAQNANELTAHVRKEVDEGVANMDEMNHAMDQINSSAQEIGKIIKSIEDIAFQTNILALNAAVEAARAGEAGKGFSVVADEVRNLASKSAEASKNTSALIENTVAAVRHGTDVAVKTTHSLELIQERTETVADMVLKVADASTKQASAVEAVAQKIDAISAVVQSNSASSEESAAASEEMSSQAAELEQLVNQFQLFQAN